MESFHLNVAVARLMELVSAVRKAIDSGPGPADPAVREGAEALSVMLSLFAPYTAEECWAALGGLDRVGPDGIQSVARDSWPVADPALLVQETDHLRGAGERQGPRPAGSISGYHRG